MAHGAFCCRACHVVSPQFFLFRVAATCASLPFLSLRFADRRLFLTLVCLRAPSFFSHRIAQGLTSDLVCMSVRTACQVYPVRPPLCVCCRNGWTEETGWFTGRGGSGGKSEGNSPRFETSFVADVFLHSATKTSNSGKCNDEKTHSKVRKV
ncbi:hypothetical protein BC826DRAFT_128622 [Russula brevipes]|nr:hypothetical protein BC826DRAFT_128622 [Russula brevipes]